MSSLLDYRPLHNNESRRRDGNGRRVKKTTSINDIDELREFV